MPLKRLTIECTAAEHREIMAWLKRRGYTTRSYFLPQMLELVRGKAKTMDAFSELTPEESSKLLQYRDFMRFSTPHLKLLAEKIVNVFNEMEKNTRK